MIVIAVVAEIGMMCVYTGGEQSALHRGNGETGGGFWGLCVTGPACVCVGGGGGGVLGGCGGRGSVGGWGGVWGGGGWGQWDTASWNHALGGAPCLMGGREVNSTAWKLYLIFIHMSAPGRDRLPQTNWNAWDQGGLQRGRQKKTLRMGGGGVHVSMNFRECIRKAEFTDMDGKAQITTAYWFSLHPHTHTHTSIIYCHALKLNSFQLKPPSF